MRKFPDQRRRALEVVERLTEAGHQALFAGGCVRDEILEREPEDFDVVTSARPDEIRALFPRVIPVGEQFGVELVMVEDVPVEVATFRRDDSYSDGRHPDSVAFSDSPEEDARRRDFTVNGLFADPASGEVLDFVGGREDLEAGVIRAIGDPAARFEEDRLRMLRAVRFACALGFEIEPSTLRAVSDRAHVIESVSWERKRDEIVKIISGPAPSRGLALLLETGLLAVLLPEVRAMVGVEQPPEFHPEGDVFVHTGLVLDQLEDPSAVLALAALLHDVGKPPTQAHAERIRFDGHAEVGAEMAEGICRRMKLSRRAIEDVRELVRNHLRFFDVEKMREARLRRFLTSPLAEMQLELCRADALGSHRNLATWRFCVEKRAAYLAEPPPVERFVTGRDLIELGMTPGPRFAKILREFEDLQLEGGLSSREEALELVRTRFQSGDEHEE